MRKYLMALSFFSLLFPTAAYTQDWSGFYVGAHGGYAWSDIEYPGANPYVAPPATCANAFGPGQHCGPPLPDVDGGFLGGQLGYNFQFGSLVLGAEADISFASIDDTKRDGNYITQSYEIEKFGSVRGRLGWAINDFLPYATVGWAWADQSFNQTCPHPSGVVAGHCNAANGFAPYSNTTSETLNGWAYGFGVEYKVSDRWSVRAEYLRYDFDETDFVLGPSSGTGKDLGSKELKTEIDTVKLGVNFQLF